MPAEFSLLQPAAQDTFEATKEATSHHDPSHSHLGLPTISGEAHCSRSFKHSIRSHRSHRSDRPVIAPPGPAMKNDDPDS
jgi:hypothetical protein